MASPADELRQAADMLRDLSDTATGKQWYRQGGEIRTTNRESAGAQQRLGEVDLAADARWIVTMSPAVTPVLVLWLQAAADIHERCRPDEIDRTATAALDFARQINGAA
ncbi:hypothetical protein DFQ14_101361 [Halopolyspora algeriensis]|uniref:Uncharacterized protein n=1 Tax=Halopolyspora algeriensis TaxID=1500506 RepID=A0A368VXT5_9ACTN|nr:hypothetical protein [Halopolyspora algeriensis]RCW47018.1 hypothetical protein DFQ14_101361 [Halopolyspora algeriensis]TQM48105.1 hypothetical protein FHU43_3065 [Halopolyspora algeriensis]